MTVTALANFGSSSIVTGPSLDSSSGTMAVRTIYALRENWGSYFIDALDPVTKETTTIVSWAGQPSSDIAEGAYACYEPGSAVKQAGFCLYDIDFGGIIWRTDLSSGVRTEFANAGDSVIGIGPWGETHPHITPVVVGGVPGFAVKERADDARNGAGGYVTIAVTQANGAAPIVPDRVEVGGPVGSTVHVGANSPQFAGLAGAVNSYNADYTAEENYIFGQGPGVPFALPEYSGIGDLHYSGRPNTLYAAGWGGLYMIDLLTGTTSHLMDW